MKLAYQDIAAAAPGVPAVVLHREGMTSIDGPTGVARASAGVGRVLAPYGDYAYYPSGMEVGGICWYRVLPGFAGTDPISLAKAVVQVGDLLEDLQLDRPVLIGWGQGGVVAVGAGLLRADQVSSVVSVDAPPGHFELLPARARAAEGRPLMLLAATEPSGGPVLDQQRRVLSDRGRAPITWCCPVDGTSDDRDKALSVRIGQWIEGG
ncbi:MAG TPA: alpha/beta hydrolase [Acidimicrobiales bacterium]|nr:alpha/beta hydrolase [Acidimicrobiales bacterium]